MHCIVTTVSGVSDTLTRRVRLRLQLVLLDKRRFFLSPDLKQANMYTQEYSKYRESVGYVHSICYLMSDDYFFPFI